MVLDFADADAFWSAADAFVQQSVVVIERARESQHPRWAGTEYPLDYGYLERTRSSDGGGVDVWRGSLPDQRVTGVIVTVDLVKRDAEPKLCLGCTAAEMQMALAFHNRGSQAGLLIVRLPSS